MIKDICERLSFPVEATEVFIKGYADIRGADGCLALLDRAKSLFFEDDPKQYRTVLAEIATKTGIHKYTVDMIFLLYCTDRAKESFSALGISDNIFYDTMYDLTIKLDECKRLYGVWGTFVVWWYPEFFKARRLCRH